MRVVVVANRGDDDSGYVGNRLVQHGGRLHVVHREDPDRLPASVEAADLVLLLGSDWSVHDPTFEREVAAEAEVVRRALERGVPLLAICYGAQLAAAACGCRVTPAARPEVGWHTIETDDARLVPAGPWFQLHGDRWWDAGPVSSFARSDHAPQAFRLGRMLGVQFHPEVTPATAERWLRDAATVTAGRGDDEVVEHALQQFGPDAQQRGEDLVDMFIEASADQQLVEAGGDRQQ